MEKNKVLVFTDGASKGNPGSGGWAAICGGRGKITELGGYEKNTTNNRMEITAAIKVLEFLSPQPHRSNPLHIYTDSSYLVNGITKWVKSWEKNNWKTKAKEDVLNKDLWQKLSRLSTYFPKISWHIVSGHAGLSGNEKADVIASAFAEGKSLKLFSGSASAYPVSLKDFSYDENKEELKTKKKSRSTKPAYSYVSVVSGVVQTHAMWKECEVRVKGKSGARFKKSFSPEDEREIIKEWSK